MNAQLANVNLRRKPCHFKETQLWVLGVTLRFARSKPGAVFSGP